MSTVSPLQLTLLEDFEYVDDTLDDSAWYDRYVVKAGSYPVALDGADAVILADATLVEEHRTTRLMNRNKVETKSVFEETTFAFRPSAAEAIPGPLSLAGIYGWIGEAGAAVPTASAIAAAVADLRLATNARRAVGTASGTSSPEYRAALETEIAERAAIVAAAQAAA